MLGLDFSSFSFSFFPLQGHVKQVLGLDFSPCGVKIATGSDDNTIRLWDLRHTKKICLIKALLGLSLKPNPKALNRG